MPEQIYPNKQCVIKLGIGYVGSKISYMKHLVIILFILTAHCSMSQDNKVIKYLALGDSYTIGESVSEADRWPNQLAKALKDKGYEVEKPRIIATTGWRTDNLKNAMTIAQLKPEYNMVSLL